MRRVDSRPLRGGVVAADQGGLEVVDVLLLQLAEQLASLLRVAPQLQFAAGVAADAVCAQAAGPFEGLVGGEDAPVVALDQQHDLRAVVEHCAELGFRVAQRLLVQFALADVDEQAMQVRRVADRVPLEDGQYPQRAAIRPDQPLGLAGLCAVATQQCLGGGGIRAMQDALVEAGLQPGAMWVAEQFLGLTGDADEAQGVGVHFPADQRRCARAGQEGPAGGRGQRGCRLAAQQQGYAEQRQQPAAGQQRPRFDYPARRCGLAAQGVKGQAESRQGQQARHGDPSMTHVGQV